MTIYTSRGSMSAVPWIDRLHDQLGRVSVEIIQTIPVTSPNLIIRVCVSPCPFRMESDQYSDNSRVGKKRRRTSQKAYNSSSILPSSYSDVPKLPHTHYSS